MHVTSSKMHFSPLLGETIPSCLRNLERPKNPDYHLHHQHSARNKE